VLNIGNNYGNLLPKLLNKIGKYGYLDIIGARSEGGSTTMHVLTGNGNGTFTDVTTISGTADTVASPMSSSVADFDEDGDLDIFMSNTASPDSCRLLVNNNDGTFTNMITQYGIFNGEFTWGSAWFDAENDTDLDLMVASDIATPQPKNYLYLNVILLSILQSYRSRKCLKKI
jgi:hypothetical protein